MPTPSALAVLLRLNLALTHHTPLSQDEILRNWLPDFADQFLVVTREQTAEVVFYEAQVLNLIRLVILHAASDGGRRCDQKGDFTLLARLLLQITDMLVERDAKAEPDKRAWVFGNRSYQSNLDGHIAPFFGAMPLSEVRLESVQEFIKMLLGRGLSPKTIGNVIVILKEMFKHAVQWRHLDANPVQYVERPRGEDKEMDVFTPDEIRRLLDAQEEPLRTLLLTAVLTGMRQGELFGLQWEDNDFARHQVHVRRLLWHGTLGTPKSRRYQQAAPAVRRLQAVRVGRPARGSKMGAAAVSAGGRGSKMGAENTKGLAT